MPFLTRFIASLFIAILSCTFLIAQTFVHEVIVQNEVDPAKISSISKDSWNRLVLVTPNQAVAYDGQSTYALLDQKLNGKLVDVYYFEHQAHHYYITSTNLYVGFPRWNDADSVALLQTWESPIVSHVIHDGRMVIQDSKNNVQLFDFSTHQLSESPYVGGSLRAMYATEKVVFLFGDNLFKWDLKSTLYDEVKMDLPPGPMHVFENDQNPYLITETGQLWQIDLDKQTEHYIDRIPLASAIIGGKVTSFTLYLFTKQGAILVDRSSNKIAYLHATNGLCQNNMHAFLMENDQHIWTAGLNDICLTTNKYPILADDDLGLQDDRMTSLTSWNNAVYFSSQAAGLYSIKYSDRKHFDSGNGFLDTRVTCLLPLNDEQLLIGTSDAGIVEMNRDRSFHYMDSSALTDQRITAMTTTDQRSAYIGTKNGGLWTMVADSTNQWRFKRMFPTSIKKVIDIIGIFNGDLVIADQHKIFYYDKQSSQLKLLFTCANTQRILDMALWDGWIYIALTNEVIRLPMQGSGNQIEHFSAPKTLRSNKLVSIHALDQYIYIVDDHGAIKYSIKYFETLDKNNLTTYPYTIITNGLTKVRNQVIAATTSGIVELDNKKQVHHDAKLILENIRVNDISIPHSTRDFSSEQNRWLIEYVSIAPEYTDPMLYHWSLVGKQNKFSGSTDQRSLYFPYLPSDEYTLTLQGEGRQVKTNQVSKTFCIKTPFYDSQLFKLGCLAVGLLLFSLIWLIANKITSNRMQKRNTKLQWENEKLEWQQKALQLQMNPHFIFNALNSIQSLVGKDDKQAKYYIAKLGKLMRMTLHHSRERWISLSDEIDILTTYLDLEKLNRPFTYSINKQSIEPNVSIPPMMLQPIVENAVKHGVHKLATEGHIDLNFSYAGRKIKCVISDNGPGISKDRNEDDNHISVSTKVINERMELYAKEGVKVDPIKIMDLTEQGRKGTEVQIGLPYQQYKLHDE